jgi:predicted nuclease of restriction endonuclease-like (RecB) superfamily
MAIHLPFAMAQDGKPGSAGAPRSTVARFLLIRSIQVRRPSRSFPQTLPAEDSDLTQQILEDPYSFEFMTLSSSAKEGELERELLKHLRDLLLELGRGFAFVGSQVQLEVDGQPFYIDLLFYHLRLHRYFVIELKSGAFKPEHAGKLSFYLSAVDGIMRTAVDGPGIGVLLCESRSGPIVEYALQNIVQPIGISTYRVTRELPEPLQAVPSVEDLQEVVEKAAQGTERGPPGAGDGCGAVMTGEPVMYCLGQAGATGRGAGRPHCWRRAAAADDKRCFNRNCGAKCSDRRAGAAFEIARESTRPLKVSPNVRSHGRLKAACSVGQIDR